MKKIILLVFCFVGLIVSEVNAQKFSTHKGTFKDTLDRSIYFRGINLSGSSKIPVESNANAISFVGKPFPINEAEIHFERLQRWGFNFIRLLVTWEALEHSGPGLYDFEYINYIKAITKVANKYGLNVMIDAHQDVWSRFTGGDGAPLWTLEKVGFNVNNFNVTNAALLFNSEDEIPPMIWPTNYSKLASSTMFSLFFGGNDFAPKTIVEGQNIQNYLQNHYIKAYATLAKHLKNESNIIGFEVMNEPHPGYIGHKNLMQHTSFPLRNKACPTPAESMKLGAGYTVEVENWKVGLLGLEIDGAVKVNTERKMAWKHDSLDVWKNNGVWKESNDSIEIVNSSYFSKLNNEKVRFSENYYKPFIYAFSEAIRKELPKTLIFIEKPFANALPEIKDLDNIVNATHWYDQITLIKKTYLQWASLNLSTGTPVFGEKNIDQLFKDQTYAIKKLSMVLGDNAPTLIGEVGIPFDLSHGVGFNKPLFGKQKFIDHNLALDRSMRAMEANVLHYALWNYTPDNTNAKGDLWNEENLSIYSLDQKTEANVNDINNGGRGLRAAVRPFASAVAGNITQSGFDMLKGEFTLTFNSSDFKGAPSTPSVIVLPDLYYEDGFDTDIIGGELVATNNAMVWHFISDPNNYTHNIVLTAHKSLPKIHLNSIWYFPMFLLFLIVELIVFLIIRRIVKRRS